MSLEALIIWYSVGSIGYFLIRESNKKMFRLNILASIFFISSSFFILHFFDYIVSGVMIALLFVLFSFLPRFIVLGIKIESIRIINFSWILIMGIACGCIVVARKYDSLDSSFIQSDKNGVYYTIVSSHLQFLVGKSIDALMVLGSVLAACMSILWAGAIWRKKDPDSKNEYNLSTRAAGGMVYAYFVIFISIGIWILIPLYNNIDRITKLM